MIITALINSIFGTYLESLKRDLSNNGFESILLIISITLIGSPLIAIFLLVTNQFQMPGDYYFYLSWFALALLTVIQFTLFIVGMTKTRFLAANAFSNLAFVTTILYAVMFLREPLSLLSTSAVLLGLIGAILFFDWQDFSTKDLKGNIGLLLILFSVVLSPLESILYKVATLHTDSYHQFLTGRVTMDFLYYSIFTLYFGSRCRKSL